MKKEMKKAIEVAEKMGWGVDVEDIGMEFRKFSNGGQDFSFIVEATSLYRLIDEINRYCDNFDVSEHAYNWLDSFGHGTNGAPYDMKEVYEDMESCLTMVEELKESLDELYEDFE